MDALSEALTSVRMTGAIFYHAECSAPWGFRVPHVQKVAHVLAPGTERLVSYHLVTDGKAVVSFPGEEDIAVTAGDILIIPHGDAHTVSNGSPSTFLDSGASLDKFLAGSLTTMRLGGGAPPARRRGARGGAGHGAGLRPVSPAHRPAANRIATARVERRLRRGREITRSAGRCDGMRPDPNCPEKRHFCPDLSVI